MTQHHFITNYILDCIENNIPIKHSINLHSTESIPVIIKKPDGSIEQSFKITNLLTDLIHFVDIKHWDSLIDEKIFDNESLLIKSLKISFAYQDARFMESVLYCATQVVSNHINGDNSLETNFRIKNMRNIFSQQISKYYPLLLSNCDNLKLNENKEILPFNDFLDKFMDLNTISLCLLGSNLAFDFKYSQYPLDLDTILISKEKFVSSFKKQISIVSQKPFHSYSFTDSIFEKSLSPVIDSPFMISVFFSQLLKDDPKFEYNSKITDTLIKTIDLFKLSKINITHQFFTSIFQSLLNFNNEEILQHSFSLKKHTAQNKANTFNSTFALLFDNPESSYENKYTLFTLSDSSSKHHINLPKTNLLLNLLSKQKNMETILDCIDNPAIILANKNFQNYCERPEFVEKINKNMQSRKSSSTNITYSLINTILIFQLIQRHYPNKYKVISKNIPKILENFISNSCDLTKENLQPLRWSLLKGVNHSNFNLFLKAHNVGLPKEEIESMILDVIVSVNKEDRNPKPLKF